MVFTDILWEVILLEGWLEGLSSGEVPTETCPSAAPAASATPSAAPVAAGGKGSIEINSQTPGNVWKILKAAGDSVNEGEQIMILEAMKMEIDIIAEKAGVIKSIEVNTNDAVVDGQLLATME